MIHRKALLIGVSSYASKSISNLPKVHHDITALSEVFHQSEYDVQAFSSERETTRTKILIQVSKFLKCCSSDDLAIVYLSGHGLHLNGKDYFVPSDADDLADNPAIIPDLLVEVSFKNLVKHCKASTVILIVDACREGVEITPPDKTKSLNLSQWGDKARADSENKQNVFIFSCSSGQLSQFETGDAGLSIFTRALVNILTPDYPAQTLGEILEDLGSETSKVCKKEGLPDQSVKIIGEFPSARFRELRQFICSGKPRVKNDDNIGELYIRVQKSPLWTSAIDKSTPLLDQIKKEVEELAKWCSSVKPLTNDVSLTSFHDDKFFLRCLDRLELMLYHPRMKLSCLELACIFSALLLAELHYLKSTSRAKTDLTARNVKPSPIDDFLKQDQTFERYRAFAQAFLNPDHIENLIEEYSLEWAYCNETVSSEGNENWYLGSNSEALYKLIASLDFLKEVGGDVLQQIASCFIKSKNTDSFSEKLTYKEGSYEAQSLSAKILGEISYISGRMAIHIGSFDSGFAAMIAANKPIVPSVVFSTLNKVKWIATDDGQQSLSVECDSSILDELIQQHVDHTNSKITGFQENPSSVRGSYLQIVKGFKSVVADRLTASRVAGNSSYIKPHVKIRLEDNKMRDLLMGDQLYGDPNLALRELYQNAQDACQIRNARVQYLRAKNQPLSPWQPRVSIRLSYDESGQGVIECEDNGSGMSLDLLKNCFTFAGQKLTDTSLFIQEQQQWQSITPSIKAQLISRFGIGVLSYFMLSNEIQVYTRHFTPLGELSNTAYHLTLYMSSEVTSISHSKKLVEGGTIVRLMLRPEVISEFNVDQLFDKNNLEGIFQKFLGSNCFQLQLSENNKTTNYAAGDLLCKPKKNVLSFLNRRGIPDKINIDRLEEEVNFSEKATVYADPTYDYDDEYKSQNGEVWFYENGEGYVLADGMLTDITYPYVTVNLVGDESPKLSVDRKHVQSLDKLLVESKLLKSISDVLDAPWITADWIWRFAEEWPSVVDQLYGTILEDFEERAFPLRLPFDESDQVLHIKLSKCGLFSHDRDLIPVLEGGLPESFKLSSTLTMSRLKALKGAIDDKFYAVMDTGGDKKLFHEKGKRVWFWQEVLSKALSKKCNDKFPWVVGEVESLVIIKLAVSHKLSIASLVKEFTSLEESTGVFIPESSAIQLAKLKLNAISTKYIQEYVTLGWHKVAINRLKLMLISSDMKVSVGSILDSFYQLEQVGVISFSCESSLVEDVLFQEKDIQVFRALTLGVDLSEASENLLQESLVFEKKRILAGSGKAQISIAETLEICKKIAEFYKMSFAKNFTCSNQIAVPELTQYLIARNPDDTTKLLESEFSASHILRFCSHYLISLDVFVSDYLFFFKEVGGYEALEIAKNSGFDPMLVEDRKLVSRKLNGKRPWISGKVSEAHILQASKELKVPISKLITKIQLWEKALRISAPVTLVKNKDIVTDDIVGKALSRNLNGSHPWVSIKTLIDELTVRAFLLDISCDQLILSCSKYFDGLKEEIFQDIDVIDSSPLLIRSLKEFALHRMRSGGSSILPIKISTLKISEISIKSSMTIYETIDAIRHLPELFITEWDKTDISEGFRLPKENEKKLLIELSNVKNKESNKGQKELARIILNIAIRNKVSPKRIVEIIETLRQETGLVEGEMPNVGGLVNPLNEVEISLLSVNSEPTDDWLSQKVSIGHIVYASSKLGLSIELCLNAVRKYEVFLGLILDEVVGKLDPARTANRLDVYLISRNFDEKPPWKPSVSDSDIEFASMVLDFPTASIRNSMIYLCAE